MESRRNTDRVGHRPQPNEHCYSESGIAPNPIPIRQPTLLATVFKQ